MSTDGTTAQSQEEGNHDMPANVKAERFWVVVLVQSGIPVSAEVYQNWKAGVRREKTLRSRMRPDNDEIGIFEVTPRHRKARAASGS